MAPTTNPDGCPVCPMGKLCAVHADEGDLDARGGIEAVRSCRTCGTIVVGYGLQARRIVPACAVGDRPINGVPGELEVARGIAQLQRLAKLEPNHRDHGVTRTRAGYALIRAAEALLETSLEPHPSTR